MSAAVNVIVVTSV